MYTFTLEKHYGVSNIQLLEHVASVVNRLIITKLKIDLI